MYASSTKHSCCYCCCCRRCSHFSANRVTIGVVLQFTRTGREVVYHTQGTDLTARDITSAPTIAQIQTQISIITAGGPPSRSRSSSMGASCLSVEAAPHHEQDACTTAAVLRTPRNTAHHRQTTLLLAKNAARRRRLCCRYTAAARLLPLSGYLIYPLSSGLGLPVPLGVHPKPC